MSYFIKDVLSSKEVYRVENYTSYVMLLNIVEALI